MKIQVPAFDYYLDFLLALAVKELKTHHRNAILGFLWIFLNPLLQMAVIGFFFSFLLQPKNLTDYIIFLFSGLLPWNFFSLTAEQSTAVYIRERQIVKKMPLCRELIPLSTIAVNALNLLIGLALFLLFSFIVKPNGSHYLVLLFSFFWLTFTTIALSLIFSILNVFYRDTEFIVKALTRIWFYATPVIYPFSLIPEKYWATILINPLSGIINLFQFSFMNSPLLPTHFFVIQFIMTFMLLILGLSLAQKKLPSIVDWL